MVFLFYSPPTLPIWQLDNLKSYQTSLHVPGTVNMNFTPRALLCILVISIAAYESTSGFVNNIPSLNQVASLSVPSPSLVPPSLVPSVYSSHHALILAMSQSQSMDDSESSTESSEEMDLKLLLDKALNADVEATSTLLEQIKTLREQNDNATEELAKFLDDILCIVDRKGINNILTRFRATARLSRRARRASLHRLLDISTPEATPSSNVNGVNGNGDTEEAKQSRRRRALVVALRSLIVSEEEQEEEEQDNTDGDKGARTKTGIPIYKIEKMAKKDLRSKATAEDMATRVPAGLETPKYDVIVKRTNFEIRTYEQFAVCSVKMNAPRPDQSTSNTDRKVSQPQLQGASSFGALAGYLFGKNQEQTAMKMTTPVLTSGTGQDKVMAFVLPSEYWKEDSLQRAPTPLENSLVELKTDGGGERAVIMFGGFANSKDVEKRKKELMGYVEQEKGWNVKEGEEEMTIAQYNDPFTSPWKRRNEVSIPVQALRP